MYGNLLFIFRVESLYDMNKIGEILKQARRARCRARCVIPVILFEGKVNTSLDGHMYLIWTLHFNLPCTESGYNKCNVWSSADAVILEDRHTIMVLL